jgi:hypothetical protein
VPVKTTRLRTRIPLTVAMAGVLLVGAPLMTGCSLINTVVNSATTGTVPEGLGTGTTIPADFPSEVPLIDGEILFTVSLPADNGEKAWNVSIKVSGADAFDTIKTQLTDAGFDSPGDSGSSGVFRKDDLTVLVGVGATDGDQWAANYTVTNAQTNG